MPSEGRERTMVIGALVTMAGGLLLASGFLIAWPGLVLALGGALFVAGLIVIVVAGGLREAWDAFKAFIP